MEEEKEEKIGEGCVGSYKNHPNIGLINSPPPLPP